MAQTMQYGGKFCIPVKLIPEDRFAALDFGTSLLKVVYIRKEDREILKSANKEDRVDVYSVTFSLDSVEDALDLILAKSMPDRDSKTTLTFLATGLEAGRKLDSLQKKLGVRIILPIELDSEVQCIFKLINSLPKEEVVLPPCHESVKDGWSTARTLGAVLSQIDAMTVTVSWPHMVDTDDEKQTPVPLAKSDMTYRDTDETLFPFFMVLAGSTHLIMEVSSDGTAKLREKCARAGRSLLGLGSLLTGAKSYDELLSLAEKGDNSAVDLMAFEGFEDNASTAYDSMKRAGNTVRANWSKCFQTGIEDWKKEDLAKAVVCMMATELADWVVGIAEARGVKRALFFGSMPNHPLMRAQITSSFAIAHSFCTEHIVEMEFINNGSHMGALGALMCDPHPGIEEFEAPASR